MVSRNRKFPTPHGYSRSSAKRVAESMVQDALDGSVESRNRLARDHRLAGPDRHVALDLGPRVIPGRGVDIRAALDEAHARQPDDRHYQPGPSPWWSRLWQWLSWQ